MDSQFGWLVVANALVALAFDGFLADSGSFDDAGVAAVPAGRVGSLADGSVARTVARICSVDLVVVDDIGMLPAGQVAAEAFYRFVDAVYKRRSVAVTSNIHPSDSKYSAAKSWPPR